MSTIKFDDGRPDLYIQPTSTDRQREESHTSRRKNDERVAKLEAEQKEREAARRAALPSEDERFQALLLGTTRSAAKFRNQGAGAKAEKLSALADKMAAELDVYRSLTAEEKAPRAAPLLDAVALAGRELAKKLPACFPSQDEAEAFAWGHLPLAAARREQVLEGDRFAKLSKNRGLAKNRLWDLIEEAAKTATGIIDTSAIRVLEDIGMM